MDDDGQPKGMGEVIRIDQGRIRDHPGEMVRGTVEEALKALLDAEADRLRGAGRYARSEGRRVEDITEALRGTRVSPGTVSKPNRKIHARIEGDHPYLYLDGIVMKRTWAGEVRNVSLLGRKPRRCSPNCVGRRWRGRPGWWRKGSWRR